MLFLIDLLLLVPHLCVALSTQKVTPRSLTVEQQLLKNYFSITSHIQDPALYSASWADACRYDLDNQVLVTTRDVSKFEVLSLCSIHAIGLRGYGRKGSDWIVYDESKDGSFFLSDSSTSKSKGFSPKPRPAKQSQFRYSVPLSSGKDEVVFCDINPIREAQPGWMGHLARSPADVRGKKEVPNCCVLPLTTPLCALVSTTNISIGTPLVKVDPSSVPAEKGETKVFFQRYRNEIAELEQYMNMARPNESSTRNSNVENDTTVVRQYYNFPTKHKGLHELHQDPKILAIPNFLSDFECDRLIRKANPNLIPCVTKNPKTGAVEEDESRTSRNTNVPQVEVPSVINKLCQLANCEPQNLEVLQVLHYAKGQYFNKHTDGFTGPISACGFKNSARLATIFVYLNDVPEGGETRFTKLDLDVKPEKGKAVVHFPTSLEFEEDIRTEHEGIAAVDDKWLLVTWVWMDKRDEMSVYAEHFLDPLDNDII
ncbi:unnamed protein product [Cylindrotheca closterium]|uniref:Prolyl 4-hydroxylase alpha subunit domain-containing protein n=1 Tax=Cylindrotheca closterium TaxID=2856 RepID=A0AAD2FSI5_9STRA|nr:unnamed protein product [Cylindrotheca closterium]